MNRENGTEIGYRETLRGEVQALLGEQFDAERYSKFESIVDEELIGELKSYLNNVEPQVRLNHIQKWYALQERHLTMQSEVNKYL